MKSIKVAFDQCRGSLKSLHGVKNGPITFGSLLDTSLDPHRSATAIRIGDALPRYGGTPSAEETLGILISNVITRVTRAVAVEGVTSFKTSFI